MSLKLGKKMLKEEAAGTELVAWRWPWQRSGQSRGRREMEKQPYSLGTIWEEVSVERG